MPLRALRWRASTADSAAQAGSWAACDECVRACGLGDGDGGARGGSVVNVFVHGLCRFGCSSMRGSDESGNVARDGRGHEDALHHGEKPL